MAKKHTYKVTLPGGEVITRTTARTYTHVVVFKYDAAKREAHDTSKAWLKTEASNHAYYSKNAADVNAGVYGAPEPSEYAYRTEGRAKTYEEAKAWTAKYPTVADYSAACLASRRAYSASVLNKWQIAGWCGRLDLAHKVKTSDLAGESLILPVPPVG